MRGLPARQLAAMLVVNVVLPVVTFKVLTGAGISTVPALAVTAVYPAALVAVGWARRRRLDAFGLLFLVVIGIGTVTSLASGNPRFFLLKESLGTGAAGLAQLGSLLFLPRPLGFYFGQALMSGGSAERAAEFDRYWQVRSFRRTIRLISAGWGCALIADAVARLAMSYALSISAFLVVTHALWIAVLVVLIPWSIRHGGRAMRRAAAQLAEAGTRRPTLP